MPPMLQIKPNGAISVIVADVLFAHRIGDIKVEGSMRQELSIWPPKMRGLESHMLPGIVHSVVLLTRIRLVAIL